MAAVTDFTCVDAENNPVACDAHGNNVAFACLDCDAPVLAVVRDNQRGSASNRPTFCKACGTAHWVEPDASHRLIHVRRVA